MKITFLGTAAAEGIPALFCNCENCEKTRKKGGRAIRTRSGILINDDLMIDFSADTYFHMIKNKLDLTKVKYIFFTHSHQDHFYPEDLIMTQKGFSTLSDGTNIALFGTSAVKEKLDRCVFSRDHLEYLSFHEITPFETITLGDYHITAMKAVHDPASDPVFYVICDGKSAVMLANDTAYFCDETRKWLQTCGLHFDLVSLDCTYGTCKKGSSGHMSLSENVEIKDEMIRIGVANKETKFYCHHFSHFAENVYYPTFVKYAKRVGFDATYDGLKIDL